MSVKRSSKFPLSWPVFFCIIAVMIAVVLAVPAAFGLQNFNQWGGMYDDHWCYVDMYSDNPHVVTGALLKFETQSAGDTGTSRVYSGPMANESTCLAWTLSRCGKKSQGGWIIRYADPYLKKHHFMEGQNACDVPRPSLPWYIYDR